MHLFTELLCQDSQLQIVLIAVVVDEDLLSKRKLKQKINVLALSCELHTIVLNITYDFMNLFVEFCPCCIGMD